MVGPSPRAFYKAIKAQRSVFDHAEVGTFLHQVDAGRVMDLAVALSSYIGQNLTAAIHAKKVLSDYRMNPYVLMTSGRVMELEDTDSLARFLADTKLYMALETSFGKSIESQIMGIYPIDSDPKDRWSSPVEKAAESMALANLSDEEKAQQRIDSIWREVDRSCVLGSRRYLLLIKSGPQTINDSQVAAMQSAIATYWRTWRDSTFQAYPDVTNLDIVLGLTYGTDRTTNNKENQILVKLLSQGFEEIDRVNQPGVLVDSEHGNVRAYRRIGQNYWALVGKPDSPSSAPFVFLEVLLGLAKGLAGQNEKQAFVAQLNAKMQELSAAIARISFSADRVPDWMRDEFTTSELQWMLTALTAFYDEGI